GPVGLLKLRVPLRELRGGLVDATLQRRVEVGDLSIGALEIGDAGPQLLPEAAPLDPACHSAAQLLDLAGLDEVVVCAGAERLDRRFERRVAGEHDRDGLGVRSRTARRTSSPSPSSSRRSVSTRSYSRSRIIARAPAP